MSKTMLASPEQAPEQAPKQSFWRSILSKYIRPAVVLTLLLTILTGFIYPGVITGLAQLISRTRPMAACTMSTASSSAPT